MLHIFIRGYIQGEKSVQYFVDSVHNQMMTFTKKKVL